MKYFALLLVGVAVAQRCHPDSFECANGRCIPIEWKCDGDNDCGDESDEAACGPCDDDEFTCSSGRCIPGSWQCDGCIEHCIDGSDEQNCPSTPCDGFHCPNGRCISDSWVCDGDNDCIDWSDETNCPYCPGFECPVSKRCIQKRNVCDGTDDCGDGSDETEEACPCEEDEFRCDRAPGSSVPGQCIPEEFVCDEDGIWDCPNGSDEANCNNIVRRPHRPRKTLNLKKMNEIAEEKEARKRMQSKGQPFSFVNYRPQGHKKFMKANKSIKK